MDFVDGTLHRHNSSNIQNFFLYWRVHLNETRVHSWISTVIRGNVKELGLYLTQTQPLFIPVSLFTCESLTSLELGAQHNVTLPKYISFPRLKRLKLYKLVFSDECWNDELFSNSTALEELILDFCIFDMRSFCISIPTLKLLKIHCLVIYDGLQDCALKINAPSLLTFAYSADVAKEYAIPSFLTLVEAVVCFKFERKGAQISRLLRALAHVKRLTVNDSTLQTMCSAYDPSNSLLTFHNVKMLNVSDVLTTDQGLIALLKAVPNLESLVFNEYINDEREEDSDEDDEDDSEGAQEDGDEDDDVDSVEGENNLGNEDEGDVSDAAECDDKKEGESNDEDDSWALGTVTTGCLFPHLKSVFFEEFAGNPRELKWVKLILKNAKALQTMNICYYDTALCFVNGKSEKELMEEIPSFPRASTGCVVRFRSLDGNSVVIH